MFRLLVAHTTAALTVEQFTSFATQQHYPHPKKLTAAFARLQDAHPFTEADTIAVYQGKMQQLASLLLDLVQAKSKQVCELQELFAQHPDQALFGALPGAGAILAPALLAHFGDDRERFPSAASDQALAGTCPVTEQSGKRRTITFRTACDHHFRDIAQ
jgi:transposase